MACFGASAPWPASVHPHHGLLRCIRTMACHRGGAQERQTDVKRLGVRAFGLGRASP
jgi:hypothetical protein